MVKVFSKLLRYVFVIPLTIFIFGFGVVMVHNKHYLFGALLILSACVSTGLTWLADYMDRTYRSYEKDVAEHNKMIDGDEYTKELLIDQSFDVRLVGGSLLPELGIKQPWQKFIMRLYRKGIRLTDTSTEQCVTVATKDYYTCEVSSNNDKMVIITMYEDDNHGTLWIETDSVLKARKVVTTVGSRH